MTKLFLYPLTVRKLFTSNMQSQVQTAFNLDTIAEENSRRVELQSFSNIENTFDSGANVPNNNVELLINYKNMHPTNS